MREISLFFTEYRGDGSTHILNKITKSTEVNTEVIDAVNNVVFYEFEKQIHKNTMFFSEYGIRSISTGTVKDDLKYSFIFLVNSDEDLDSYFSFVLEKQVEIITSEFTRKPADEISHIDEYLLEKYNEVNDVLVKNEKLDKYSLPSIKENEIEHYAKLLTYHLMHQMHTHITDMRNIPFLSNFLLPFQFDYSTSNATKHNKYFFVQLVENDDAHKSEYEKIEASPWCTSFIKKLSSLKTIKEKDHYCQQKFDECIKLGAGIVAVASEKFRTTGTEKFDENQIKDICTMLNLENIIDIKTFIGVARIYEKSIYAQFFKLYEKQINQFI